VSPDTAAAVASCRAVKVLVPVVQPHVELMGIEPKPLSSILDRVAERVAELLNG